MAAILFLLSLQHSSLFHSRATSKGKTLTDTTVDWAVSKSVTVMNDPLVKDEQNVDTEELKDEEIEVKEREGEAEEKEVVKEEIEDADAKDEPQEDDPEEGNLEGLRLGDEATSVEDETPEEDAEDDGFLQVILKSVPVSFL